LQATHADFCATARVIVGQYGPAAAQARSDRAPGITPAPALGAAAESGAAGTATATAIKTRSAARVIRPPEIATKSHYFSDELALCPAYDPAVPREPRDEDLLQELYSTGLLVGLLVDAELEKLDVPRALFSFIGWISSLQPVTPRALAAETGLPPTTIRDYVRRLVERGDVHKTPNPNDGRSYHLVLTPKGTEVANRGWPAVVAAFERVERHLARPASDHLAAMRELRRAVQEALASQDVSRAGRQTQARRA
jgi:DNA-binding MarR family transcriptional regulator